MSTFQSTATFTRPTDTTAYASGDLVANSTTAGSVVPMAFTIPDGKITQVRLTKSTATATNSNYLLYLFQSSPTVTNGDNGAFVPTVSNFLGTVALDQTGSLFATNAAALLSLTAPIVTSGTVYGLLKATAAYTPANAEVYTVTLFGQT